MQIAEHARTVHNLQEMNEEVVKKVAWSYSRRIELVAIDRAESDGRLPPGVTALKRLSLLTQIYQTESVDKR